MTASKTPALRIDGLSHRFKQHRAVDDVSFTVAAGAIHGFVGPNGAGKTTTLKVIATLLEPQVGRVEVFGTDVIYGVRHVRRSLGYMPDHFALYRQMTVAEYLDFFGAAYGLRPAARKTTVHDVLQLTDMYHRRDDVIKGLSRGMQQRVSLARVLVHDPKLLLLDEPASGLDPRARIELMDILRELQRLGKTVFISSHILSELATLCDSVTIIDRGRIRYSGGMEQLLSHAEGEDVSFELQLAVPTPAVGERLGALDGVLEVGVDADRPRNLTLRVDPQRIGSGTLLNAVIAAGGEVERFQRSRRHLDQAFMDLTEPGVRS
ncbi:MAG: ABC transporter ATP-binding protein [Planctomycetes bacterium]|nr:ABC transporter ATP-binding protein [Planctomycetota bacterium]MCB9872295.1 ABC transporter ATP-binding protein [Planctomycetota bacterium]